MKEPSEELLDRHFRQQVASYKDVDQARAKQSDRLIMARWMKVFERTPLSQKLARNSLMLLMHGHIKDFGVLKEPFTDMRNCSRNLNAILDEYRGQPCKKVIKEKDTTNLSAQQPFAAGRSSSRAWNALLKKCSTQILRPRNLTPIKEVAEPSEKEPTTSSFASIVTVIRQTNTRSSGSNESLDAPRTDSDCDHVPDRLSVRQRVQSLEDESPRMTFDISAKENIRSNCQENSSSSASKSDQPASGRTRSSSPLSQEKINQITNVIDQVNRRSCAVQNLKECFEEMAERLKKTIEPKCVAPTGHKPKIPPPPPPPPPKKFSRIRKEVSPQRARQTGSKCHPSVSFEDITVQQLLIRREKLRIECLAYYNLDGTMKDVKDMPDPPMDTRKAEQRASGFIIGAYRALARLKRWRGKSKQLRFFKTCFQKCGLRDFVELQALDRRFERVALQWYRRKVMDCQRRTWRNYRRIILAKKPSYDEDDLQLMRHQLELQEELQRERMVHLVKIKEICKTSCCGIISSEVLNKMLKRLDDEHDQLAKDLESLLRQKEQLFQ
ncbi:uncharacterized protein LOC122617117 [Drosophila teissieri]|uniref:uncharacterized protein LOC122617117 n=1 Tax=Drosophila teissieri TaxID=7243 RepID=UPI001CB9E04C|nr:uncharacterized protein LOC122617117 [Drosophila teissieri]XP_043648760.1 uncharacterized protein LOC122617117 [Drosophila teissieri]